MSVTSALPREQAIARILELTGAHAAKHHAPWLVVTAGLPGSGKSTFSRRLAKATGAVVLESDELRAVLFGAPVHDRRESTLLFEGLYGAAQGLLLDGVSVIVDATNLRERDREQAYKVAARTGARILVLHFRASEAVTAERLSNRERRCDIEDKSTAGMAVYRRMAETEEPVSRDHWKIDTSDPEATDRALQRAIETLRPTQDAAIGPINGGSKT